jgi:Putative lumazine-binding
MKNARFPVLLFSLFMVFPLVAQKEEKSEKAIKAVINQFFEGLEKGDTTLLRSTCTSQPVLQTYMADRDGKWQIFTEDFNEFVAFVGTPTKDQYNEEIEFEAVLSESSLASVWTPYKFYFNGKVSHCGTNSFQLVKIDGSWKIQYILDTRRKTCK